VQAVYNISPAWQAAIGVFNNNPASAAGSNHGRDWALHDGNRGVLTIAQLNWHRNQGVRDAGMPGVYSVGAFFDGNDFTTTSGTPASEKNNWGIYAMGQQQVASSCGSERSQGLTIWASVTYSRDQNLNPLPLFAAAGATCQGPVRSRPNDVASIGWYYASPSDRIQPPASRSQALELNYQYTISAAVNIVVDAQYLFRLNGYPSRGTTVLGTQVAVTF
jgi:porin